MTRTRQAATLDAIGTQSAWSPSIGLYDEGSGMLQKKSFTPVVQEDMVLTMFIGGS
jgi:hypothetical protein